MPKKRISRRFKDAGILSSVGMVLVTLLAAAAVLWVVFTRLLRDAWPWQEGGLETANPTPGFQTTQLVLTLVGGIGAAILVVVAYRRQRDLELARFDERFAAAAAQLGAGTAAERLAGVYAMAALADVWEIHRQQCIDVLCGYLRLPYDPSSGLLKTVVSEHTWPVGGGGTGKEIRTYEQLPNDREVRLTIIKVITSHLWRNSSVSWQGHDLNFTGATFDGGDFSHANFSGGHVNFDGARFVGSINFFGAKFSGSLVSFLGVKFSASITFGSTELSSGHVLFSGATFLGGAIGFTDAAFSGAIVSFGAAELSGASLIFKGAHFSDGSISFGSVRFVGGYVKFEGAEFTGARVDFQGAKFRGSYVTFKQAVFSGGLVWFDASEFFGGSVTFDEALFQGGEVTRDGEIFRGWSPTPVSVERPAQAPDDPQNPGME
jgi:uncharacterized protein YjbI with pentapeptide repeats